MRIGAEFLKILLVKTQKEEKTIFQVDTFHESGDNFCRKYGGICVHREEENRLYLKDVNWTMIDTWKEEGRDKAPDVSIERFQDVPEKDLEEFCLIYTETQNQVPLGDLEWEFGETPKIRRLREERYNKLGAIWITSISREKDGTISGLTETLYFPSSRPTFIDQLFTGIKEEYRGRGLGKWLKTEMLTYIKERFPEVKVVATDFASTNASMIAINKRLGFKTVKSWTTYKFKVIELAEKLEF